MDYFKKCPKCGRYMSPYMHYKYGNSYTVWFCDCGYFEDGQVKFMERGVCLASVKEKDGEL